MYFECHCALFRNSFFHSLKSNLSSYGSVYELEEGEIFCQQNNSLYIGICRGHKSNQMEY